MKRRGLALLLLLGVLLLGWRVVLPLHGHLRIALGYAATIGALLHFESGDSLERVRRERLPAELDWIRLEVDKEERTVTASAFGFLATRARHRPGLGATRDEPGPVELPARLPDLVPTPSPERPWPHGAATPASPLSPAVAQALEAVVAGAFGSPSAGRDRGTHAVVVAAGGVLVAERYAPWITARTPLLGWSMTKSVTATLVGRLVLDGRLALDASAPVRAWSAAGDPRAVTRLDDLLRMRSGVAWNGNYTDQESDSLRMLFLARGAADYAAARPTEFAPGTHWEYCDGTSNVLARIVKEAAPGDPLTYPQRALFAPLGMDTAVISVDGTGTFVGSSLMLASARDWARLGELYLRDGVWNGERLLPVGWVDEVTRVTPGSAGRYGAHFWRSGPGADPVLAGTISARGYQGQLLAVDRGRGAVLVRLGADPPGTSFDEDAFTAAVWRALASAGSR